MGRNALMIGGLFSLALLGACQASTEPPTSAPQPVPAAQPQPSAPTTTAATRSLRSGVYTTTQAQRGQEVFNSSCVECHAETEWTDASFLGRWNGQSVHRFYTQIHDTMPYDNPGSLTPQQYADVVAYIFQINSMPTGSSELPTDQAGLEAIRIDWTSGI